MSAAVARLQTYVALGRVSNLPTVWSNALAAVVLAGAAPTPGMIASLSVSFSLFYVGGMFLNDAFDHRYDARVRPDRPIPSGRIRLSEVYALGFAMLVGAVASLALHSSAPAPILSGVALVGAVVLYDAWHKNNPLSPLLMGLCRVLIYLTAALAVAGTLGPSLLLGAAALLAYLIGLTFTAKQEHLARLGNLWPLLFLLVPFALTARAALASPWSAALWLAFAGWVSHTLWRVKQRQVGPAVVQFIAGISLLDALWIFCTLGERGLPLVAAALGCFALTLALQRYVKGT